jgi:2-polyprenyl-6-methoxyphenol hydroxylase-like FAD-dependent oxidoreductase
MDIVHADACIVGGGPAGLLLGLMLAKRGAEVIVLEGHETFDREFRGEVLQPSTVRLLDRIGLLEDILAEPHSLLESGKFRINGRVAGEFSFKRISPEYPYAIWMPQPIFLAALHRKASAMPTFQSWMGAKVSSLVQDGGRTLGVRGLRHGKEPFEIHADVVIGADGRYSSIAKMGGFTTEYEHHDFEIIWFVVDQPPGWSNTLLVSLGDDVRGLMLPKFPNQVQVGILLRSGEWKEWRKAGVAAVANRLRGLDPICETFANQLEDFTPFCPLAGFIKLIDDWSRDGLLLIGDAAHTMSPAGAIGVNVALSTAAVAAQEIYPHLGHGPIPRQILARVQQIREADVRMLHRLQLNAQAALIGSRKRTLISALLPKLLPIFLKSPLLPRVQRRVFFGAPLPPLDPAFRFEGGTA